MQYSIVYVGMDVHKDSFSLCCYTNEKEKAEYNRLLSLEIKRSANKSGRFSFYRGLPANRNRWAVSTFLTKLLSN